ncbi:glutamate-rich protein 1 [Sphaeramia orbicularis]|uniref:Glutamate-rich 1 n=1 Tax=Sphaeramia orbicularis TaxID=375764 RepID=A0A673AI74_9TELE|nr:glutamate-rich protein 1 [Sphaeramia orbicularis]
MAHRKEVFQSKVLQKLYPAPPKLEKESGSPHIVQSLAKKTHVKRKSHQITDTGDAGTTHSAVGPTKRIYTVLPPPADYMIVAEQSATLPQQGNINSVEDPAEESVHESNEEIDQGPEEKKRRRRKRKKPNLHPDSEKDPIAPGHSQTPGNEGEERISRNKKRKLKKKRHKEKLLSMGLMPRTAALEFTYQRMEQEEEQEEERAAEVLDFLRTTVEIYKSDSSFHAGELSLLSDGIEHLLSSIAGGHQPTSVLKQLHTLKTYVQQKDSGRLTKELEELRNTTTMSAEETTAVITLFQYWITDILPMQRDQTTGLSTKHLRDGGLAL